MANRYLMAVDAGTGSVRAVLFNEDGAQLSCVQREWTHAEDPRYPGSMDFDWVHNWELASECIRGAIAQAGVDAGDIAAVSTTCMREGIVLYDEAGEEIWACPPQTTAGTSRPSPRTSTRPSRTRSRAARSLWTTTPTMLPSPPSASSLPSTTSSKELPQAGCSERDTPSFVVSKARSHTISRRTQDKNFPPQIPDRDRFRRDHRGQQLG